MKKCWNDFLSGDNLKNNPMQHDPNVLARAKAGDPAAQYLIGLDFSNVAIEEEKGLRGDFWGEAVFGDGADSYFEAVKWYFLAADEGYAPAQFALGQAFSNGRGVQIDLDEAIKWYRKAAEQGSRSLQFRLGYVLEKNSELGDWSEMTAWYRKAAEQGHAAAQYCLGKVYDWGLWWQREWPRDTAESLKWIRAAAEQGYAPAQWHLGLCYSSSYDGFPADEAESSKWYRRAAIQGHQYAREGLWKSGVQRDLPKELTIEENAVIYYRDAADMGDSDAMVFLGLAHSTGAGVEKDHRKAVELFDSASPEPLGWLWLGMAYFTGEGVEQDNERAVWYFKLVADRFAHAKYTLGVIYSNGTGVKKDAVEAFKWYFGAAEKGHPEARVSVALAYLHGAGVEKNGSEGIRLLRSAAQEGNVCANNVIGDCYSNGDGVAKNPVEAVKWYRRAAEKGSIEGQCKLAAAYAHGNGVPKNEEHSLAWLYVAIALGSIESKAEALRLEGKITDAGRGRAQSIAAKLFADIDA